MARPKRQGQRRRELISAAQVVLSENGVDGARLNRVAEAAGVTSGTVLYYYPDFTELVEAAIRATMERFAENRSSLLEQYADHPIELLRALVASGLPSDPGDPGVRILSELGGSAGRNATWAMMLTSLYDRQVSLYQLALERGVHAGVYRLNDHSLSVARNAVALEDAYGYRIVAGHPTIDHREASRLILSYLAGSTGCSVLSAPRPETP